MLKHVAALDITYLYFLCFSYVFKNWTNCFK